MSTPPPSTHRRRGAVGIWIATLLVALLGLALLWWRGVVLGESTETIDPDRIVVVEARDVIDSLS